MWGGSALLPGLLTGTEDELLALKCADRSDDIHTMFVDEVWTKCTVTKINSRLKAISHINIFENWPEKCY